MCAMEDVLDLYAVPYDPQQPVVCVDERPCVLHGETLAPQLMTPTRPARYDYEYVRQGTANLFIAFQPLAGWRLTEITARRTRQDFAHFLKRLVDEQFSSASVVHVVLDNLNIHRVSALYTAFTPAEARRIAQRLVFHYTPRHASWLNMVEIELSVLVRQCLRQRIGTVAGLSAAVQAWTDERNRQRATIKWCFRVEDARTRLARFYP